MLNKYTTVYHAASISEVQMILKNITGVSIVAGCTEIARRQTGRTLHLSANILALARVPELCTTSKTERYLEFGPCVTLNTILQIGKKNIPEVLYEAVRTIGNPGIRSIATLGGNIAAKGQRLSTFAPLLALDTQLEIRTAFDAFWIPMSRYFSNTGREQHKNAEFISRIRIPTETWIFRTIRESAVRESLRNNSGLCVLAKSQKNILADIRIAYAGKFFFRKREFENLMIGRSLPLSEKDIIVLMDKAELFFDKTLFPPSYERKCLFNLLEESLRMLT